MMKKIKGKYYIGFIILFSFVIINCWLVFREDSEIPRAILITDYERINPETQREYIEKDAILTPAEEIKISANATELEGISVRTGQLISSDEEIAVYKKDHVQQEQKKLEVEREALIKERTVLENILSALEDEHAIDEPITTIKSEQIDEDLSITIEAQIDQRSPIEAKAMIESKISHVTKSIEMIEEQLSTLNFTSVLSSPIDGIIGDVGEGNGIVTVLLYGNEKELRVYLTPNEWEQIQLNQFVELDTQLIESVDNTSLEMEENQEEFLGEVIEKQDIPVHDSFWYDEFNKVLKFSEPIYYEARVQLGQYSSIKPFGNIAKVKIIVNEALNATRIEERWVLKKKVEHIEGKEIRDEHYIYTINAEGIIRLSPISIAYKDKGEIIFYSESMDGKVVVKEKRAKDYTDSFLMMPFELPNKKLLSAYSWKDYIKNLLF